MNHGVGHRHSSDPELWWLWCRPASVALEDFFYKMIKMKLCLHVLEMVQPTGKEKLIVWDKVGNVPRVMHLNRSRAISYKCESNCKL